MIKHISIKSSVKKIMVLKSTFPQKVQRKVASLVRFLIKLIKGLCIEIPDGP